MTLREWVRIASNRTTVDLRLTKASGRPYLVTASGPIPTPVSSEDELLTPDDCYCLCDYLGLPYEDFGLPDPDLQ